MDYIKYRIEMLNKLRYVLAHLPNKYRNTFFDIFEACVFGGYHFDTDDYKSLEEDWLEGILDDYK